MKKIFTILLALISVSTFAQRTCDMEVVMTKPTANQKVAAGFAFDVAYTVKNLGPDKLMPGDTIFWGFTLNGSVLGNITGAVLNAQVAKDSFIIKFNNKLNINFAFENPSSNFCAFFIVQNRIEGNKQVNDPVATNNSGCKVLNMTANMKTLGNGLTVATKINASPNPANNFTNISYELINPETVTVSLYDMNGRLVITPITDKQGAGENSIQLNTSELISGLYFYEVKIGNDSKRYKLMVD